MIQGEKIVFCPGTCPLVPEGVTAEVCRVVPDNPEFNYRNQPAGSARVYTQPAESSSAHRSDGVEAVILVAAEGQSTQDILAGIADCKQPTQPGKIAKALGAKGTCQGVQLFNT